MTTSQADKISRSHDLMPQIQNFADRLTYSLTGVKSRDAKYISLCMYAYMHIKKYIS